MSDHLEEMKVVWMSAGVSSFIAGYYATDVDQWIYIDIADQHPDSLRFIKDCEKVIKKEVLILKSDNFTSVDEVCRKTKTVNTPYGAPCTGFLKKAVRANWERQHLWEELIYVWGMDCTERRRANSIVQNFPEFKHEFPLIEKGLTKQDCHAILNQLGIKRPKMYDLGYQNNNCIGCVKGGMWYWNKIRKDFPDVFKNRAKMERDVGRSCMNGLFLDELEPNRGRKKDEINQDCGVICHLTILGQN